MQFSALDLLDDDPLGLFEDNKPRKKRNRRRAKNTKSIYEGLDEFKENEEETSEVHNNCSNSFMKQQTKQFNKTVTFNDEEINIPLSSRPDSSDLEEFNSNLPGKIASSQSTAGGANSILNDNSTHEPLEKDLMKEETSKSSIHVGIDKIPDDVQPCVLNDLRTGDSVFKENLNNKSFGESHLKETAYELSKRDIRSPAEAKEPTSPPVYNESAPFFETREELPTDVESIDKELKNNNTAWHETALSLNTYEEEKEEEERIFDDKQRPVSTMQREIRIPNSRHKSPGANETTIPGKPIKRKMRLNMGDKVDTISMGAQLNDTPVSAIIYSHSPSGEDQPDKGRRDLVVGPLRKVTSGTAIRRPSSCHSIGRYGITAASTLDTGDLCGETNAAALRMMAYKNWYQRHLKSAQKKRVDSLKQDTIETKNQRESLERIKSNEQAFEAWRAKKRAFFREQLHQKRAKEEQRQRELNEASARRASSSKVSSNEFAFELDRSSNHPRTNDPAFEVWKSRKDGEIRKQYRESLSKERALQQTKAMMEAEKRAQSEQAFATWKAQKEAKIREVLHSERQKQSEEEKKREEEARIKSEKAAEAYYQWELRKVASVDNLQLGVNRESVTERFPWRPPSTRPTVAR